MSKTEDVMEKLGAGMSTKEITEETGCSKGLVSQCRKRLAEGFIEDVGIGNVSDEEIEAAHASFVKRINIKPDPEPVKKKEKTFYVTCGSCKADWEVTSGEQISTCPYCGVDLQ